MRSAGKYSKQGTAAAIYGHSLRPLAAFNFVLVLALQLPVARSEKSRLLRRHSVLTPELKNWFAEKGYLRSLDHRITISEDGRLIANEEVAADKTFLRLPRHLTLSWLTVDPRGDSSSALGRAIAEHPELFPSRLVMPVWLAYERHRSDSLFGPYLRSLPTKLDLPILWKDSELSQLNGSWIHGAVQDDLSMLRQTFKSLMSKLCQLYPGAQGFSKRTCDVSTWKWAWAILWSRGVQVTVPRPPQKGDKPARQSAATTAALVPFADMANHVAYSEANAIGYWDERSAQWVLQATTSLLPGDEILISYGDNLGNKPNNPPGKASTR